MRESAPLTASPTQLLADRLMTMKVPELRSLAKQHGLSGYSKLRKHELATLLVRSALPVTRLLWPCGSACR